MTPVIRSSTQRSRHPESDLPAHARRSIGLELMVALIVVLLVDSGRSAWAETTTPALVDDLLITRWTVDDGLPLDHLNALALAPEGALWIATYDGLVRFDGRRFDVLRKARDPRLPNNRFVDLARSPSGAIWARAESGELVRVVPSPARPGEVEVDKRALGGRHVETFPATALAGPGARFFARGDALWAMSLPGPIDLSGPTPRLVPVGLNEAGTSAIRTPQGTTWVSSASGLYKVPSGGSPSRVIVSQGELVILDLDSRGDLWVGGAGLYRVELNRGERVTEFKTLDGRPFEDVCAIVTRPGESPTIEVRDRHGWWRLGGQGATLIHAAEVPFCDATAETTWPWRIAGRHILRGDEVVFAAAQPIIALLPTPDGGAWVAPSGEGLVRIHPRPVHAAARPATWTRDSVDEVHLDHDNALWVVSLHDGLARLSPPLIVEFPPGEGDNEPLVLGLVEHGDGRLEVGTDRYLCTIDPGSSRCEPSPGPPSVAKPVLVPLLFEATPTGGSRTLFGGLGPWVRGTHALFEREVESSVRWKEIVLPDGSPIRHARRAVRGPRGTTLVATADQGLIVLGAEVQQLTSADGLSSDRLRSLHVDSREQVWIGTEDAGLCRYRPVDRKVECVGVDGGLHDDVIHAIMPDTMNRLWLSGNRGLSWVRLETVERVLDGLEQDVLAVTLDTRDGMPHREGNGVLPHPAQSDGQRLFFATQGGVAVLEPRVANLMAPPHIALESVQVDGVRDPVGGLNLTHGQTLTVTWSAPSFSHGQDLRFRYRLGDGRWSPSTQEASASWAALPAGPNTIEVQAGLGGQWSRELLRVLVERTPTFSETVWFPIAVGLLVLLLGALSVWGLSVRQRRIRARLEIEVKRRTEDLRAANTSLGVKTAEVERQAARLAEVNDLRQRFVADLSHELRTPLSLIAGPIEDLFASLPSEVSRDGQSRFELVRANIARLEVLSDQLLDVARLEGGSIPLRARRHGLGVFLAAIVARFSPAFSKKGLSLKFETTLGDGPVVYFDGDLLDKVVTNLLSNALKFTLRGGVTVSVRLREGAEGFVLVRVSDTGIGIDLDKNATLFTRFYQVDRGDTRRFEGVGIGLALVRDLVALHGGEVGVESRVGEGSTFWFELPLGAAHLGVEDIDMRPAAPYDAGLIERLSAPGDSTDQTLLAPGPGVPLVLLVEDNADMRAYLAMHLREHFLVAEADGGEQALDKLAQWVGSGVVPASIVSDVMMPGLDGISFAKRLKGTPNTANIPIILVSAKAGEEDRVAGLEVADDYLTKPVRPRELVMRIKRLLRTGARSNVAWVPERREAIESDTTRAAPETTPRPKRPTSEIVVASLFPEGVPLAPIEAVQPREVATVTDGPGHVADELPVDVADDLTNLGLEPANDPASLRQRARLDQLIDESLPDESFGVIELAAALGTSRRQLQREVRRLTGEPPSDYLRRRRMERAQQLLIGGARDTVAEVSAAVGLSPAYFSRLYAAWHGHPPSDDLAR